MAQIKPDVANTASDDSTKELIKIDVSDMPISDACEEVRNEGWAIDEIKDENNSSERLSCSTSSRKVSKYTYSTRSGSIVLYSDDDRDETANSVDNSNKETGPSSTQSIPASNTDTSPSSPSSSPTKDTVTSTNRYQSIYDEYSARLRSECPSLSVMGCAEITSEGVGKMAECMIRTSGTDGQYETYSSWASRLQDVYMNEAM